jgi:1-acyl-sn-glycerol-3-phosphate acyltransferase
MTTLRAIAILVIFLALTLLSIPWQQFALTFRLKSRKSFPHRFQKILCNLFGVRVTVLGTPVQDRGVLMVANHTGYFDIIILAAAAQVSFVAKSEVKSWPLFGLMATLQETVYIDRSKKSRAGESREVLRARLLAGDALVLFPEGTSSDGNRVHKFKSALIGAAEAQLETGIADDAQEITVQPVSIAYVGLHGMPMGRENRALYAWYGDMELLPHLWEALKTGPFEAVVEFHPPIAVERAGGRKEVAALAETVVRQGLMRALNGIPASRGKTAPPADGALAKAAP